MKLDAAIDEWRGPALADVADEEWARSAAVRWDELRLAALEARFDALLALAATATWSASSSGRSTSTRSGRDSPAA